MGFTSERAKLEHDKARLERELDELRGELGRLRESIVTYRVSDQVRGRCTGLDAGLWIAFTGNRP